jgi:hypothetical protein
VTKSDALTVYIVFVSKQPNVRSIVYVTLAVPVRKLEKFCTQRKLFGHYPGTCVSFTLPANLCLFSTYSVLQILDTGKYFHFIFFFQIDIRPCYFDERCKGNQYSFGPNKNGFFPVQNVLQTK